MGYREKFDDLRCRLLQVCKRLSQREIFFISATAVIIVLLLVVRIISWTHYEFRAQAEALAETQRDLEQLEKRLGHYVRLKARKTRIEEEYQKADLQEGGLGYLDNLIQTKLGLSNVDFDLNDAPGQQLGEEHEQVPFRMVFRRVADLDKLVDFLAELTRGPKPFIVTSLTLEKRGNFLNVDINASAIRRVRE